ncbi:unnamed protein product [Cylindrotheca closterium]|uniref:P-type Cu(+) transporter n=1 Tax=Cylindrotheca closterium TaxID=2856 RepID=A0AAD2FUL8_9STRA|nr:unnamed protein product [Cylindrotheca closterium]
MNEVNDQATGNPGCSCACDVCYCGPNCKCTESLCRCEASSVLNSLSGSRIRSGARNTSNNSNEHNWPVEEIGVSGMTCSMCTSAVEQGLQSLNGVKGANCSLATHQVRIEYDSTIVGRSDFIDLIEAIGYETVTRESSSSTVELSISGMTCTMCSQAIETALLAVHGVEQVAVSLTTNSARVQFDSSIIVQPTSLVETVEDIGYECSLISVPADADMANDRLDVMLEQQEKEVSKKKRNFYLSVVGALPTLLITMVLPHIPWMKGLKSFLQQDVAVGGGTVKLEALILFVLCTPVQFGCGWPFYKQSFYGLKRGVLGMDVLVALGTTASYGYALWATFTNSIEYHFYETSTVLICFVLLGKLLQSLAVRRTSAALTKLLSLQPKTAIKVTLAAGATSPLDGAYTEEVVPLQAIVPGDLVKVLKGASIPADGTIRFGEMSVDESMITGESIPVLKTEGSIVLGGTICSESGQRVGAAFVTVTGVGASTALSQIVQLVQDAQNRNREVPIQNLADKVSGIFVPTVVALSTITFMVWYALIQGGVVPLSLLPEDESPSTFSLLFAIAVLVISCPCSLGLSLPTAIMMGTGVGAQNGILFKGGETLESGAKVDSLVFDKTGTLTLGKPGVTDFNIMSIDESFWNDLKEKIDIPSNTTKNCVLWLLASLERNSEHPLAGAVVAYAEEHLGDNCDFQQPSDFTALTGRGASATINGDIKVAVGNRAFGELQGLKINEKVEHEMQRLERQGKTAILAAFNSTICVVMGIADELKPGAAASVKYLKDEMGIDVWMVTGDNRRTARAIARQLDLPMERVIAEALPASKVAKVQQLQEQGCIVAMVGDGVNDSPALAQANVGLSLGTGAEIACEASDMVLIRGNVEDVCTALDLSRVILQRIRLNFMWSLVYNCLSIPIAAGVFYPMTHARCPPTAAALAMALSSISVVLSSIALRLYRPPQIGLNRVQPARGHQRSSSSVETENDLTEPLLAQSETDVESNLQTSSEEC